MLAMATGQPLSEIRTASAGELNALREILREQEEAAQAAKG